MVLDALGAFALACNVLQAVEFGAKILSKAIEYGHSDSGLLVEHQALETITLDLMSITTELATMSDGPNSVNSAEAQMQKASKECLLVSQQFLAFLDRFKMDRTPALWKRIGAAMRLVWRKEKMASMMQGLTEARSNLNLAFLVHSHSRLEQMMASSSSVMEQKLATAIQQMLAQDQTEQARLNSLSSRLQELDLNDQSLQEGRTIILQTCKRSLRNLSDVCADVSSDANSERNINYDNELLRARHSALKVSFFPEMHVRFGHVSPAHHATFAWALQPPGNHGPKPLFSWLASGSEQDSVFWISGKPGSGKSTLLHYICGHLPTSVFGEWKHSGRRLVTIKHFFWKSGHPLQRSLEGLTRSLMFQLLQEDPSAFDDIQTDKTQASFQVGAFFATFPLPFLTIRKLIARLLDSCCLIMFLDGLDELGDNDEDRSELLAFLKSLPPSSFLKVICSSRPWVIFEDHFARTPQIRLEDLTKTDIQNYVHDKLYDNVHFKRSCINDMDAVKSLISDIVKDAQGVFLWVYLVIRELLVSAQHGANIRMLRSQFNSIPRDLTEYFRKIMENIEPGYAREASALLQIQLDYTKASLGDGIGCRQPRLLELSFLDLDRLDFAWDVTFAPGFSISEYQDRKTMQELMVRRINSRCMGLLEVSGYDSKFMEDVPETFFGSGVEFFHRSFAEFLSEESQEILHLYTQGVFNTRLYRLNAQLVLCRGWNTERVYSLRRISYSIFYETGCILKKHPPLSNNIVDVISQLVAHWSQRWNWVPPLQSNIPLYRSRWQGHSCLHRYLLHLAAAFGWIPWLKENLEKHDFRQSFAVSLLDQCFQPTSEDFEIYKESRSVVHPNAVLVMSLLLSQGLDPNLTCRDQMPIVLVLNTLLTRITIKAKTCMINDGLKALIKYGAKTSIPTDQFSSQLLSMLTNPMAQNSLEEISAQPSPSRSNEPIKHGEVDITTVIRALKFPEDQIQELQQAINERGRIGMRLSNTSHPSDQVEPQNPSNRKRIGSPIENNEELRAQRLRRFCT